MEDEKNLELELKDSSVLPESVPSYVYDLGQAT